MCGVHPGYIAPPYQAPFLPEALWKMSATPVTLFQPLHSCPVLPHVLSRVPIHFPPSLLTLVPSAVSDNLLVSSAVCAGKGNETHWPVPYESPFRGQVRDSLFLPLFLLSPLVGKARAASARGCRAGSVGPSVWKEGGHQGGGGRTQHRLSRPGVTRSSPLGGKGCCQSPRWGAEQQRETGYQGY